MKRFFKYLWAYIKCDFYLLTQGMWKGESKLAGWGKDESKNQVIFIAATTGSIWDNSIQVKRVFWNEEQATNTNDS